MINLVEDIDSLTNFKRNTAEFVKQLHDTGRPLVLTVNGKAELVVQDAASYQALLALADQIESIRAVQEGLADLKAGRTTTLADFKKHMRPKHGV